MLTFTNFHTHSKVFVSNSWRTTVHHPNENVLNTEQGKAQNSSVETFSTDGIKIFGSVLA
jgi:hypothetical protein